MTRFQAWGHCASCEYFIWRRGLENDPLLSKVERVEEENEDNNGVHDSITVCIGCSLPLRVQHLHEQRGLWDVPAQVPEVQVVLGTQGNKADLGQADEQLTELVPDALVEG